MIESASTVPPMRAAMKASKKSVEKFKVGAAISNKNKVLAVGFNKNKTHTKYCSGGYHTTHAEGDAIGYDLSEVAQYNIEKLRGRAARGTIMGSGDNR